MPPRLSTRDRFLFDPTWPQCYFTGSHPDLPFDRSCKDCTLNNLHHNPPQLAVSSTAPDDLSNVKLIVVSDYPGAYEIEMGFMMVDNNCIDRNTQPPNAGASIRWLLRDMFGLDTYHDVFWSNAVHCARGEGEVHDSQVSVCAKRWLRPEFEKLGFYAPDAPVLIAGSKAYKACKAVDPATWAKCKGDVHSYRRQVNYLLGRPAIFTINPAPLGRSIPYLEQGVQARQTGGYMTTGTYRFPLLPGSAEWHLRNDLEFLRPFLT